MTETVPTAWLWTPAGDLLVLPSRAEVCGTSGR